MLHPIYNKTIQICTPSRDLCSLSDNKGSCFHSKVQTTIKTTIVFLLRTQNLDFSTFQSKALFQSRQITQKLFILCKLWNIELIRDQCDVIVMFFCCCCMCCYFCCCCMYCATHILDQGPGSCLLLFGSGAWVT